MKNVVLIGCGGYGAGYVDMLLEEKKLPWKLAAVVDPYASSSAKYEAILAENIPVYDSLEAFFEKDRADVAIISTPITFHAEQAVRCLEQGLDVLMEKPAAGSVAEVERIRKAVQDTGSKLVVGFQWSANDAMLRFKKDADEGRFGKLLSMKALVFYPRDLKYYHRGIGWAGKCYDKEGRPVFDSIASNATAHYLFNELWVAGKGYQASGFHDVSWTATRANDIETYDTVMIQGKTDQDADFFYGASHAVPGDAYMNPIFEYRFEKGTAYFGGEGREERRLEVLLTDGSTVDYGISDNTGLAQKAFKAEAFFSGTGENVCPIEAAEKHIELLEYLWNNGSPIRTLTEEEVIRTEERVVGKNNLEFLWDAYRRA